LQNYIATVIKINLYNYVQRRFQKKIKIGDLVYAQIIDNKEWQLCYVYQKSDYTVSLMATTVVEQPDETYLCKYSVTRAPGDILSADFFIKTDLIRNNLDGWSLKKEIEKK